MGIDLLLANLTAPMAASTLVDGIAEKYACMLNTVNIKPARTLCCNPVVKELKIATAPNGYRSK